VIDEKDTQLDVPEEGSQRIVDMDGPTLRLVAAVESAWHKGEWILGAQQALSVADRVRHAMGLKDRELSGRLAVEYLERVIRALEQEAERAARVGWGRYRSLWYLRRLPPELFGGDDALATTAPYEERLTEVLMTRGSDPEIVPERLDDNGCFPIDESVARRLVRTIGFAKTVSEYQRHYRRCAKGATLRFGRRDRLPEAKMPDETAAAIRLYDERVADDPGKIGRSFDRLGTPALEVDLSPVSESDIEERLILVGELEDAPVPLEIDFEHEGRPAKMLIPAYHMVTVSNLRRLAELMTHPQVGDPSLWHEDIPLLIAVLNLEPLFFKYWPSARFNLFKQGYVILGREELEDVWDHFGDEIRSHMAGYLGSVADTLPTNGGEFASRLLRIEGSAWPLVPGSVAFQAKVGYVGVDLANVTRRLIALLEYPPTAGKVANIRAGAFELATQDMIDATRWSPPDSLKRCRGRHLRLGGEWIGEVDAIAELDGPCILVSCKSRVYTAAYDMGLHSVVRNTADYISRAVEDWEALVDKLRNNPVGDNYDLSAVKDLRGVVITPSVMYVPIAVAEKESVAGLRYYSSLGELEAWLSSDSG